MPSPALSFEEVKVTLLERARERQASLERGELNLPLRYTPLPLTALLDFLSQWEYRRDSLGLAVPPPTSGLSARLGRLCKSLVSRSLRWLFIRQVEFNTAAIRHAQALAELLAVVDKNQAEFLAALTHLKLQVHALADRLSEPLSAEPMTNLPAPDPPGEPLYRLYLDILLPDMGGGAAESEVGPSTRVSLSRSRHRILVLGSGRGDFLRFLVSEGIFAQGVETDAASLEYCRERELPVDHAEFMDCLGGLEDGSLAGIILERAGSRMPARQLASLFARCWTKLKKGGVLIAEMDNPETSAAHDSSILRVPIELTTFLIESQCFTVVDSIFSMPMHSNDEVVIRTSEERAFDLRRYCRYAVVGRR